MAYFATMEAVHRLLNECVRFMAFLKMQNPDFPQFNAFRDYVAKSKPYGHAQNGSICMNEINEGSG